jgi:hypothetical protein
VLPTLGHRRARVESCWRTFKAEDVYTALIADGPEKILHCQQVATRLYMRPLTVTHGVDGAGADVSVPSEQLSTHRALSVAGVNRRVGDESCARGEPRLPRSDGLSAVLHLRLRTDRRRASTPRDRPTD